VKRSSLALKGQPPYVDGMVKSGFPTRQTFRASVVVGAIAAFLGAARPASAAQVVVPVAIWTLGSGGASWSTEIRVTNRSNQVQTFRVLDFIGYRISFAPGTFEVPANQTVSLGAYDLLSAKPFCAGLGVSPAYYGAFVVDLGPSLEIRAGILAGTFPGIVGGLDTCDFETCPSWQGGYPHPPPNSVYCVDGAGPLFENTGDFFPPGTPIYLSWLHTQPSHRTNISLYNPDLATATVSVSIEAGDGSAPVSTEVAVPGHSVVQLNDVFSTEPFISIRVHNGEASAAADATLSSSTRLYAIGWIIASQNNTVAVSQPR